MNSVSNMTRLIGAGTLLVALACLPAGAQCFLEQENATESTVRIGLGSGSSIMRFEGEVTYIITSPVAGLFAAHGWSDPVQFCETGMVDVIDMGDWQFVLDQSEWNAVHNLVQANGLSTFVYPLVEVPPGEDLCYIVLNYEPLAVGTADMTFNSNDEFFSTWDVRRRKTWGGNVHGVLWNSDGERVIYNGHMRCSYRTYPDTCGLCDNRIQLH